MRDWTDARDMVVGIYFMMHKDQPDDFVLGSGQGRTILELIDCCMDYIGIEFEWKDAEGIGIDKATGNVIVEVNDKYKRPLEVNSLIADTTKAKQMLGWKPKISFEQMIQEMIDNDVLSFSK